LEAVKYVRIEFEPRSGLLRFESDLDRVTLLAILEMASFANLREMAGGAGRPSDGGVVTGTVRSPALAVRRADSRG